MAMDSQQQQQQNQQKKTSVRCDPSKLRKRYDRALKHKDQFRSLYEDAYQYALPNRNLLNSETPGEKKVDRMFDSTGQSAVIGFVNRLHNDLTPPFQKWVDMAPGPFVPEKQRTEVKTALEDANNKFFAALRASNFDTAAPEGYAELAIGTMPMLFLEGDDASPFQFVPVPFEHIAIEEGAWGNVSGVFRTWRQIEIRVIKDQWSDAQIPEEMQKLQQDDDSAKVDLFESTYYDKTSEQWLYDVCWKIGGETKAENTRLVERDYPENPWLITRLNKLPGEAYGRGPVILAMPDIKTINKITELVLKNAALNIAGVYTAVDDGVLNPNVVVIAPGAVIPVASNGGSRGPSLQSLRNPSDLQFSQLEKEELTMRIKQMLLDNRLPPEAGPVRSATEIVERIKELATDRGSLFGRMMHEFILPLVRRGLGILYRRGIIQTEIKLDGLFVEAQVLSPLAKDQNLNEVEAVVRALSILAGFGNEILTLSAKMEDIGPWIMEQFGVPAKLIRSTDEREALQKMAGQMAAQQQQQGQQGAIPIGGGAAPMAPEIGIAGQAAGIPLAA
jgi:hypothetical protein